MITLDLNTIAYIAAATFTIVSGTIYGIVIHYWRKADPDSGVTPLWVAIGVMLGIIAMGILYGAEVAAAMGIVFAILGVPQVVSYYMAHIAQKSKQVTAEQPSFFSVMSQKDSEQ